MNNGQEWQNQVENQTHGQGQTNSQGQTYGQEQANSQEQSYVQQQNYAQNQYYPPEQNYAQQPQIYYHDQPYQNQQYSHNQNINLLTDTKVPHWRIWLLSAAFAVFHIVALNLSALIIGMVLVFTNLGLSQAEMMKLTMSSDVQNLACVGMFLICAPVYLFFLKKRNGKFSGSLALKAVKPLSSIGMIFVAFGALGVVTAFLKLIEILGNHLDFLAIWIQNYLDLTKMVVSDEGNLPLMYISTVILVPIAEELLFRGIIQGELNLRYSPRIVVLLQAILFGIFHMNPIQSMYTFIPGLLLGIAYYYTGNLVIPIVMHMIFNLFGGVLTVVLPKGILSILNYAQLIVGIFSIVVVVIFFIKAKPDSEHKLKWEYSVQNNVQS